MSQTIVFWLSNLVIPFLVLLFLHTLREMEGFTQSGGADVISVFLTFDILTFFNIESFSNMPYSSIVKQNLIDITAYLAIISSASILVCIRLCEEKMANISERIAQGFSEDWAVPLLISIACVVLVVASHGFVYLGDWK